MMRKTRTFRNIVLPIMLLVPLIWMIGRHIPEVPQRARDAELIVFSAEDGQGLPVCGYRGLELGLRAGDVASVEQCVSGTALVPYRPVGGQRRMKNLFCSPVVSLVPCQPPQSDERVSSCRG